MKKTLLSVLATAAFIIPAFASDLTNTRGGEGSSNKQITRLPRPNFPSLFRSEQEVEAERRVKQAEWDKQLEASLSHLFFEFNIEERERELLTSIFLAVPFDKHKSPEFQRVKNMLYSQIRWYHDFSLLALEIQSIKKQKEELLD